MIDIDGFVIGFGDTTIIPTGENIATMQVNVNCIDNRGISYTRTQFITLKRLEKEDKYVEYTTTKYIRQKKRTHSHKREKRKI